ncbi:MAG: polysaccharide biosynthesis tyrosine autokinase [Bacteroidales bacterium]|nr:polysaccharide biosynthesis tyrosine autokinase [Bacteroidales bacterium]
MNTTANQHNAATGKSMDMKSMARTALRYWWLFILSFVVCFGLLFLYLRKTPDTYIISSTMLIEDNSLAVFGGSGSGSKSNSMLKSIMGGGDVNVNNEIEILSSESLCAKTIAELGINCRYYEKKGFMKKQDHYGTSPIVVEAPKELFDTLSVTLPFKIKVHADGKADITVKKGFFSNYAELEGVQLPATVKTPYGLFVVKPSKYFTPKHEYEIAAKVAGYVPAALSLQKDMTIDLKKKKTDVVYVDVADSDVKRGRDILNTLVRLYNERTLQEKDRQGMTTAKFIDERLSLIYKNLIGTEAEIEAYKKAHNLIDPAVQAKAVVAKDDANDNTVVALETQHRIAGMIMGFITDASNKHSLIPFEADDHSAPLVRAYNALITQRQHLENSAMDGNPALVQLDQQIEAMRANLIGSVNNSLDALRIRINKAKQRLGESQGEIGDFATAERNTRSLYRDQAIQNELYIFLLQKREENALKMAAAQPKGKTIDAAHPGEDPVKPKKLVVFSLALLFAMALPVGWIYAKKLMDNKVNTLDDLRAQSASPVLASIAHAKAFDHIVSENDEAADEFRVLRDNLQFMLPVGASSVVAVTSCGQGEGKTYVAANLAGSFAMLGKRVALLDLNIRQPQVAEAAGLHAVKALTTFLSQESISLDDIAMQSGSLPGVDIYPAGTVPPNPSELLQSPRTAVLFERLRANYDVIVADTVGIGAVSDTLSVARHADAAVVVARAHATKDADVARINQLVADGKLKNAGVVLNDADRA